MTIKKTSQKDASIGDLLKIISNLTEDQRETLQRAGAILPIGATEEEIQSPKYGYWCKRCNGIAFYFIGNGYQSPNGAIMPAPHAGMSLLKLPWTQNLPTSKIERPRPRCQHCSASVGVDGTNLRLRDRYIVSVQEHEATQALQADPQWRANLYARLNSITVDMEGADVTDQDRADMQKALSAVESAPDYGSDGERRASRGVQLGPQQQADLEALYPVAQAAARREVGSS